MRRALLLSVVLSTMCAASAELEPPSRDIRARISSYVVESLEWMAVDSELIVRARLLEHRMIVRKWANFHVCKVRTLQAYKGPAPDEFTFVAWGDGDWPMGNEWMLFLDRRREYGAGGPFQEVAWELRQHGGRFNIGAWQAVPLDGSGAVETVGRKYLTARGDILGALTNALRECEGVPKPQSLLLSNFSPWPASDDMSDIWSPALRVPLNEAMQRQAREWAGLRVPRTDSNYYGSFMRARLNKLEAIQILSRFRSEQNAVALRGMLDDPYPDEGNPRIPYDWSTDFSARYHAWRTLRNWGEAVERPVCEVPGDLYRPAGNSLIGAALLLGACAVGIRLRWSMLGAVLGVVVLLLAWRSMWHVDSLVWSANGRLWEAASFHGGIQIRLPLEWKHSGPPGYLSVVPREQEEARRWDLTDRRFGAARSWCGIGYVKAQFGPREVVVVPHGWVAAMCMLGLVVKSAAGGVRWMRRRSRRRSGLCEQCGYDRRGSAGRCPECGEALK